MVQGTLLKAEFKFYNVNWRGFTYIYLELYSGLLRCYGWDICICMAAGCDQERFRNRMSNITTNMLAIVEHDVRFIFVHMGWEGSAHDANVFLDATSRPELHFPWPPPGAFYNCFCYALFI